MDFTKRPSWLLTQTGLLAGRLVSEGFATTGGRGYHYRLLTTLAERGSTSQATLGRRSGIHLSDLVAALNELAEQGLIERAPDPADRRRNIITLTPAGRDLIPLLDERLTQVQDGLLAPLSPDERDQLTGLLTRLLAHHSRSTSS